MRAFLIDKNANANKKVEVYFNGKKLGIPTFLGAVFVRGLKFKKP